MTLTGTAAAGPASASGGVPVTDVHHWQATWPAAEIVELDTWRLRASAGFTKRANSALALPTERPLAELLGVAETFYAERGLPSVVVEHDQLPVAGLTETVAARGWRGLAPDPILTATAGAVLERTGGGGSVRVTTVVGATGTRPPGTEPWWTGMVAAGRAPAEICDAVVLGSPVTLLAVVAGPDGPLAIGRAGLSGEWAGLNCLWTDPAHRGRGLGTRVIAALAHAALDHDVRRLQLAVESGNLRARALYERLGFTLRCHYRYWLGPDRPGRSPDDIAPDHVPPDQTAARTVRADGEGSP